MNEKNTKNTKPKKKALKWDGFFITYFITIAITVGLAFLLSYGGHRSNTDDVKAVLAAIGTGVFITGIFVIIMFIRIIANNK